MPSADQTAVVSPEAPGERRRRLWPTSTTVALLVVGAVLAAFSALVVLSMPALPWHPAREAELVATYQTYRETGVLLVKHVGEGSPATQVAVPGTLQPAAWDDDPGVYLLASLASHVTGRASPHAGLRGMMLVLVAAPLLVLPLAVARLFRSARTGYALLLLPVVLWLTNHGAVLAGTEYGLFDLTSLAPVYALYGLTASLLFLTLTALLFLSTFRLRLAVLVVATVSVGLLGGVSNLCRSMSGFGPALAVGLLWLGTTRGRERWWRALAASGVAVAIAVAVPIGVMHVVDTERARAIGTTTADLPTAHALWHAAYLGLSYPEPVTRQPSPFGVTWSDDYGLQKAREVDPAVVANSAEYNQIMRHLFAQEVRAHPWTTVRTYLAKAAYTTQHFGGMVVVVVTGFGAALLLAPRNRRRLGSAAALALPTAVLGLLPAVLVMPLLYYFSELSAALGLLVAVALGGLVFAVSTVRSHARAPEHQAASALVARGGTGDPLRGVSVVVPADEGDGAVAESLQVLAEELTDEDEIIVVVTADAAGVADEVAAEVARWTSACPVRVLHRPPGFGDPYWTGVLASRGERILLTSGNLPFGTDDLQRFQQLPSTATAAIGFPDRAVSRRRAGGPRAVRRVARSLLLQTQLAATEGTVWVDGPSARTFAVLSPASGAGWVMELLLSAERLHGQIPEIALHPHREARHRWPFEAPSSLRAMARTALRRRPVEDDRAAPSRPDPANAPLQTAPA